MKKICVVYRNRRNPAAIAWLDNCLKRVYEDYVDVEDCFMDELTDEEHLSADAFLVISSSLLPKLRRHTASLKNVVTMTRSVKKEYLPAILAIPTGTDVLLVNDTMQSSEEMVLMFYELGIGHLNLIPYDKDREREGIYRGLRYAITPNEPQMLPPYIEHVINTEYREIGFDSMVQLMDVLDMNNARVTYNLIKYISNIVEPMQYYRVSYFSSFLKERMLNEYVYDSPAAVLALDAGDRVVYCNRRAQVLFGTDSAGFVHLGVQLPAPLLQLIHTEQDIAQHPLTLSEKDFIVDKTAVLLGEERLGYLVTLQDEIVLKSIETSFNKHLREKGLYAKHVFGDIQHVSESMSRCIRMAKKAAVTDYTILIGGESGTGKELLAQAGYPNGFDMTISVPSNYQPHMDTAEVVAEQLRAVGVNVTIQPMEWGVWHEQVYKGRDFQATLVGLDASAMTARALLERFTSDHAKNFVNYNNPDYDALFTQAMNASDDAQQAEIYKQMETMLSDTAANLYIQDLADLVAMRQNLAGLEFYPIYVLDLSTVHFVK